MSKKSHKLSPDIVLKNYWADNEQFADLFNAVLFEGEQVIRADELYCWVWKAKGIFIMLCQ